MVRIAITARWSCIKKYLLNFQFNSQKHFLEGISYGLGVGSSGTFEKEIDNYRGLGYWPDKEELCICLLYV